MSDARTALYSQRAQLVERIHHQRDTLVRQLMPVQVTLDTADRVVAGTRSGVQYLKDHPLFMTLAVSALVVLKPKRVFRLAAQGMAVWRTWRVVRPWVPQSLLRGLFRRNV